MQHIIGFDIGGANLKASDGESARAVPFPLWSIPDQLPGALQLLLQNFDLADGIAVTMSGELADCFATKAQGVDAILSAVDHAAAGVPLAVWQTGAEFVDPQTAREISLLVAAANWHALATFVGRLVPEGLSLLLDMGSTTTDVVPLLDGVPVSNGFTDSERLLAGELVYTGLSRTPLCAVASWVPFRDQACPLAAELFATMLDVSLLRNLHPEDPRNLKTADGKPATKQDAHRRLARMICGDATEVSYEEAEAMALHLAAQQRRQIAEAVKKVVSAQETDPQNVLISGAGAGVLRHVLQEIPTLQSAEVISLEDIFPRDVSEAACAFAVARLASERSVFG